MIIIDSFNIRQELYKGDLCYIDGYGKRIWEVIGLSKIKTEIHNTETEDLTYYLECILTGEEIIGLQEDSVLICRSKEAFSFIKDYYGNIPASEFSFEDELHEEAIDYESEWKRIDITDIQASFKKAFVDSKNLFEGVVRKGEKISMNSNENKRLTASNIRMKQERKPAYKYPDTIDGLLDRLNDLNSQKDVYENVLKETVDEDLLLEIEIVYEELKDKQEKMKQ